MLTIFFCFAFWWSISLFTCPNSPISCFQLSDILWMEEILHHQKDGWNPRNNGHFTIYLLVIRIWQPYPVTIDIIYIYIYICIYISYTYHPWHKKVSEPHPPQVTSVRRLLSVDSRRLTMALFDEQKRLPEATAPQQLHSSAPENIRPAARFFYEFLLFFT